MLFNRKNRVHLILLFFLVVLESTIFLYVDTKPNTVESIDGNKNENLEDIPTKLKDSVMSWTSTEVISTESFNISAIPSIAIDSFGNTHIAWYDLTDYNGSGGDYDIFYKHWNATTNNWTIAEVVSTESSNSSYCPHIAVDNSGNVHVAWYDKTDYNGSGTDTDIFYKRWNATINNWTITEVISTDCTDDSKGPKIGVDHTGNIHICWVDPSNYNASGGDYDIFYKMWNNTAKSWKPIEVVSLVSATSSISPDMTIDNLGNVHIAWEDGQDYNNSGTDHDIFYRCKNCTTGKWMTTEVVSTESADNGWDPSITVDDSNNIHVVWEDWTNNLGGSGSDWDIFYKQKNATTNIWSITEVVSTESTGLSTFPSITSDKSNNVHVAWVDMTDYHSAGTDTDIFYKCWNASLSTWTSTEVISTESDASSVDPMISVNSSGYIGITWEDYSNYDACGNDRDIFYKKLILDKLPYSNHPLDTTTSALGKETINWTLFDDFGEGKYLVLSNNSYGDEYIWQNWALWTNNTLLNVPINRSAPGIYYYTIYYNDTKNQFGITDTVIVNIIDTIPYSNTPDNVITSAIGIETINWRLYDDFDGGQYRVWTNNTNGDFYVWRDWTSWTNTTALNVPINRSAPGFFNYTIEYIDSYSLMGIPHTVFVSITDNPPESNYPEDIITYQDELSYIPWILTDDFEDGYYRVFINGTPDTWKPWIIGIPINYPIDTSLAGTFNYTIQFKASSGHISQDTVIVTVRERSKRSNGTSNDDQSIDQNMITIMIFLVIGAVSSISIIATLILRKSRKKIKERQVEIDELMKLKAEITEDDILISKERHFCLVHKGIIEGYTFVCPKCGVLYCMKCIEAIKELENACWSCGAPLDPSKPVRKVEDEDKVEPFMEDRAGEK